MAARMPRNNRQEAPRQPRRGGMFSGLMIGVVVGLIIAAGLAWYLNRHPAFHTEEAKSSAASSKPAPAASKAAQPAEPAIKPAPSTQATTDYTFYGILPGEKPGKPAKHPAGSGELWWLQIAALKNPAEADRLKASLTLLGLQVVTQKIEVDGRPLYRVRVGPYQRQDDALSDRDTLTANKFEHRLLKEPAKP